jgi:hypothetical protein
VDAAAATAWPLLVVCVRAVIAAPRATATIAVSPIVLLVSLVLVVVVVA